MKKLRKFKLTDREGYTNSDNSNEGILEDHFVGDVVEGYIDEDGYLGTGYFGIVIISPSEFEFFEEVLT